MWRSLIRLGLLVAAIAPCAPAAAQYVRSSINLPMATSAVDSRHDLNGDGKADVVAVFQRRILVFFQGHGGLYPSAPDVEIGSAQPIPESYAAVAIGKVVKQPGEQLLLIGPKGVDYLTGRQLQGGGGESVEPRPLIRRSFDISAEPSLAFLDAAPRAGTAQGELSEIILPNSDRLEIYRPAADGQYQLASSVYVPLQTRRRAALRAEPDLLGAFMFQEAAGESTVATLPRAGKWYGMQFAIDEYSNPFLAVDINNDSLLDLVTRSRLYMQRPDGNFDSINSDFYSRVATAMTIRRRQVVAAPNLVDFNGDGILDTFAVAQSTSKMNPRTDVSVFLGRQDRTFPAEPDFVLRTRDLAFSEVIPIGDVNGDGALDIALINLDFQASSASSQLKSYLRNGLEARLCVYFWDKRRNRFPENYAFAIPILINYQIYGTRQFLQQQMFMSHDLNGDGLVDLAIKTGAMEISLHENRGGVKGFATRPYFRLNTAPTRFSSFTVDDLNGDGRGDFVVSGFVEGQDDRMIYSFFLSQ